MCKRVNGRTDNDATGFSFADAVNSCNPWKHTTLCLQISAYHGCPTPPENIQNFNCCIIRDLYKFPEFALNQWGFDQETM